jgi:multicomponent Na+:H+ antiporter subunit A
MRLPPVVLAAAGLVAGLAPQALMAPVLEPAVGSIAGEAVTMELALWHGLTVPFVLSLSVLAAGAACYVTRAVLQRMLARSLVLGRWGPEKWYEWSLAGMNGVAAWQTRLLQPGRLSHYVFMTVFVLLVLVTAGLVLRGPPRALFGSTVVRPHEMIAGLLAPAAAVLAVTMRSRLATVAALGVVGYSVAWLFAVFGAPDLAATQVVIESLTVILFVLAFSRLPTYTEASSLGRRVRDAILAGGAGMMMTVLLLHATNEPHPRSISQWYVEHSLPAAHGRNVVNVIIVDFRALDTLGEITVLSTAAVGVWTLLRLNAKDR